jgi:peroxiredoxin Q/BCP
MRRLTPKVIVTVLLAASAAVAACAGAEAQQPAQPAQGTPKTSRAPAIGSLAPDFSLPAATRYGLLERDVRLSDYRGKTVVLAFFFKARTKG